MHNEKDGFPITALREIKLLKLLSHRNVLSLEDMAVEHHSKATDKRKRPIMYMVTPYMDHDLSGLLDNPSVTFTVPQIKCYLKQLLQGLQYLHEAHILHRDMKAANLLINNKGVLQIADFGLARHYDGNTPQPGGGGGESKREYTALVVTRWYRPPELLMHLRKYTTAIDLWGVGRRKRHPSTRDHIRFGRISYGTDNARLETVAGRAELAAPPTPGNLSQRFRQHGPLAVSLLKELLKLDWRNRINAVDALQHPYFTTAPLPAQPGEIPTYEDSHELDRRKYQDRKAALPPAPKGGAVGDGGFHGNHQSFSSGDGYGPPGGRANGGRHPLITTADTAMDPRTEDNLHGEEGTGTGTETEIEIETIHSLILGCRPGPPPPENGWDVHSDRDHRDRAPVPHRRAPPPSRPDVDTYIPSHRMGGKRRAAT
ncbi:uncharacterized protein PG986_002055 [Apiospora aurea]|uniref:cyclin-dependent kinase n=1 Tax=Apiospora aurea TaxID=335848 RepID=A0ABR1QYN4_9PEZI